MTSESQRNIERPTTQSPRFGPEAFPRRVHLLGVGGAGVSGLGRILAAHDVWVSGHDRAPSAMLEALEASSVGLEIGESRPESLPEGTELVVRSAAVPEDDPQVLAAHERGIPVLKYAQALGQLADPRHTLAVAGTHGKTTTSWMLWHVLDGLVEAQGAPIPGALIGGLCRRLATNALAGSRGSWFVAEACEYDRTFLRLAPRGAIVTNVEADHLDYYVDLEAIHAAFARFLSRVDRDGLVVLGRDVPEEVELGSLAPVWRMGREFDVELLGEERGAFRFRLCGPGWATPPVSLSVPGHFNVDNAANALALALGLATRGGALTPREAAEAAVRGLERFTGVDRRFEPWGEVAEVEVVHDYAHHPTEVRVTVEAALRAFPERPLHVFFQPHQHSRTARFLEEFAESLRAADRVCVSDVYGARRHIDGVRHAGAPELAQALRARGVDAVAGGPLDQTMVVLAEGIQGPAAVLVLGAGDVEGIRDELLDELALRCAPARSPRP